MGNLMVDIAPVFWNGFPMGKKENQQMVSTDIRLVEKMSRFVIGQVTGKESALAEHSFSHLNR
jgi:hypothetical protein